MEQKVAQHTTHIDPPPGFAKAVSKSSRSEQQRDSPDDVLASNFSRNLNMDEPSQGGMSLIPGTYHGRDITLSYETLPTQSRACSYMQAPECVHHNLLRASDPPGMHQHLAGHLSTASSTALLLTGKYSLHMLA